MDRQTADRLIAEATQDLRARNGETAFAKLRDVASNLDAPPYPWFLYAQACNVTGNIAEEDAALDRLLAEQPRHLVALLMKGALLSKKDDIRGARSFYKTATNVADTLPNVPDGLKPMLTKAHAFLESSNTDMADFFLQKLKDNGVAAGSVSARMDYALDMLLGKKERYEQQPSVFFFPELPQRAFFEREEFSWMAEMEAQIPVMQEELHSVLALDGEFAPYVKGNTVRPLPNNVLLNDPSWGAYYFWENGEKVTEHAENCPNTMQTLALAPMPDVRSRSPVALYSLLKPGTHIRPHYGLLNTRLICHIPLITNDQCTLRVGAEKRQWEEGKALIFDDSFEHEAWNDGDQTRVILLFEIWRPELTDDEKMALTQIYETVNYYDQG